MARFFESAEGRLFDDRQMTVVWTVTNAGDELAAKTALLNSGLPPAAYGEYEFDAAECIQRHRDGTYRFRLVYLTDQEKQRRTNVDGPELEPGEWTFTIDTSGDVEHTEIALAGRVYDSGGFSASKTALPTSKLIRAVRTGIGWTTEGTDAVRPSLRFGITLRLLTSALTIGFAKRLSNVTAKVNNAPFPPSGPPFVDDKFAAGEVLFLGLVGTRSSGNVTDLAYSFLASPNQQGLTFGPIQHVAKGGHEVLWPAYKFEYDSALKQLTQTPTAVIVNQLYAFGDFSVLFPV